MKMKHMMRQRFAEFADRCGPGGPFGGDGRFARRGGPFGRRGGFMGGMMGGIAKAMRGKFLDSDEMQLLVLETIKNGRNHGYDIIKAVEELSSGAYAPSPGMIYPILSYLEDAGLAASQSEGNRKIYNITPEGEQFLADNAAELDEVRERVNLYGERMAEFKSRMEEDDIAEERWGREDDGGPDFAMRARFHEVRNKLRNAMFKKRGASSEEKQRVIDILLRAIDEINAK